MSEHKNPWTTKSIKEVYENPWIKVTHRDVLNPNGNPGIYGMVHFKNLAIGVLPLDKDYNTWLVGQYRYTLEQYSWEIPEGGGMIGVDPLDSAKRELLEETGISASKWTKVIDLHLSNSVSDEVGIGFIAQGLTFGEAEPEDTEDLLVKKVPFETVFQMTMDGKITCALAVPIILKAKILMDQGKI